MGAPPAVVEDLHDATRQATAKVTALGGFVQSESIELGDSGNATVTYRVPAAEFRPALVDLGSIGELRDQQVQGKDVTAQYADLEGRVTTLRTSISRLQAFLSEAVDVGQVGLLEGELTARESELESIESQRRALAEQSDLSSITVAFSAEGSVVAQDRALPSFMGGLQGGWDTAATVGAVVLAVAGFLLPFLPVAALALVALRWRARRAATTAG